MELINKYEFSLGQESYDVLGFDSEDDLNFEIEELIKIRPEFQKGSKNLVQIKY